MLGLHLASHEDPECHQTPCLICQHLMHIGALLTSLLACAGLLCLDGQQDISATSVRQFAYEWTPVRLKVKLLN